MHRHIALLPLLLASCSAIPPQEDTAAEDRFRERLEEHVSVEAKRRSGEITREVASIEGQSWAGSYYYGDGTGVNVSLDLAPKTGFVFRWNGCMGLYDQNYGAVEEKPGKLHLECELPNERKGFRGIATELVPVNWGKRHYLLRADGMMDFVNDVNAGSEPRGGAWGSHLLRRGDEALPVEGEPMLPAKWKGALLTSPLDGRVIGVREEPDTDDEDRNRGPVMVTLSIGSKRGVVEGMRFYIKDQNRWEWGQATAVEADRCTVRLASYATKAPIPAEGWVLSTRR